MQPARLAPIHTTRTVEAVINALEERILDGTFKDAEMLPSEEQLARQLRVGRRAVREALKVLEAKGLLEVRMGVGTIVKRNDLDSFLKALTRNVRSYLRLNRAEAQHVQQLRALLEGAALERLATTRDATVLQQLAEAVARQRQALVTSDPLEYQEWHHRFHHAIVDSLQNPVISMVYKQVLRLVRPSMQESGSRPDIMARVIEEHAQILEAISRGSGGEAVQQLNHHLEAFLEHLHWLEDAPHSGPNPAPNEDKR